MARSNSKVMRLKLDMKPIAMAVVLRHAAAELERQAAMLRAKADQVEGSAKAATLAPLRKTKRKPAKRAKAKTATKAPAKKRSRKLKPGAPIKGRKPKAKLPRLSKADKAKPPTRGRARTV